MADKPNSTWARWGAELRRIRELAGTTQQELSHRIRFSAPLVSGFERGTRAPNRDQAVALDEALSTTGELERLWVHLKGSTAVPEEWRSFLQLERQATEIREFQMALVPGLLQCPAYARSILESSRPRLSEEQLHQAVTTRISRLDELDQDTVLRFVIDEIVVRRIFGSPQAAHQQLEHLIRLADSQRIRVALIPMEAMHRPAVAGSFRVMTLKDGRHVGHVEHLLGESVADKVNDVNLCLSLFGDLQGEALSVQSSIDLLHKIKGDLP